MGVINRLAKLYRVAKPAITIHSSKGRPSTWAGVFTGTVTAAREIPEYIGASRDKGRSTGKSVAVGTAQGLAAGALTGISTTVGLRMVPHYGRMSRKRAIAAAAAIATPVAAYSGYREASRRSPGKRTRKAVQKGLLAGLTSGAAVGFVHPVWRAMDPKIGAYRGKI